MKALLFKIHREYKRRSRKVYNILYKHTHWTIPSIFGNNVNAFWWNNVPNFGDMLTPYILEHYKMNPVFTPPQKAQLFSTGSIIEWIPSDYSGYILGSGLMTGRDIRFPNAKILALRGEMTRRFLNADNSTILADPGLLARVLVKERSKKKFILGIVPHYSEKNDDRIINLGKAKPNEVSIINVQAHPKTVITHIDQCEYILSTSLHGIVVADSLHIPRAWVVLRESIQGREFKFHDYASSLGEEIIPRSFSGNESIGQLLRLTENCSSIVDSKIAQLNSLFEKLKDEIGCETT